MNEKGKNNKQGLQRLILILKLQQEIITNPLKKLKIRKHIAYLEKLGSEDFTKGLYKWD